MEAGLGNRGTALDQYGRGQALVQALIARDPENAEWQRDLSVSYDRVGDISAARGDRDGALKAYEGGLEIAKRLAATDPANVEWQRDLAISNERLGDMAAEAGNAGEAVAGFERALSVYETLVARLGDHEARVNSVVPLVRLGQLKGKAGKAELQRALDILVELRDANRLDAMRIGWIPNIEALIAGSAEKAGEGKRAAPPRWKFWAKR